MFYRVSLVSKCVVPVTAGGQPWGRRRTTRCREEIGASKYGGVPHVDIVFAEADLHPEIAADITNAIAHSITRKTWASYKSAERMLKKFLAEKKIAWEFPVKSETLLRFVHWLAYSRGLKASSIEGYLAGIRKLHVAKGCEEPNCRPELVRLVIAGRKNIEAAQRLRSGGLQRQAATPDILRLIKFKLATWGKDKISRLTVWTVCTLLLHGTFRGGELLCKSESVFDPAFDLLRKDLHLCSTGGDGPAVLQVRLKFPKEDKVGKVHIVDIFETRSDICPIKAFRKWSSATASCESGQPAFCLGSGTPLTTRKLNLILKEVLADYKSEMKISAHSFRSGAASMMAALGLSDKELKAAGRWNSNAVERYVKCPRSKRIAVAEKIARFSM